MGSREVLSPIGLCFLPVRSDALHGTDHTPVRAIKPSSWPSRTCLCDPEENIYIYFASFPDCKKGKKIESP